MKLATRHPWNLAPKKAMALQERLSARLVYGLRKKCPLKIRKLSYIAGADVSYSKKTDTCYAAVVVFSFPALEVIEERTAVRKSSYPYVPGLLTFREAPPLIDAFSKLGCEPEVLVFDGQGVAHPRRFGLAAHIGYLYNKPSIGCAKSRLIGEYEPPGLEAGEWTHLSDGKEKIGCVLRTRTGCRPLFISPGHRMDVHWALNLVKKCLGNYRQPRITRRAHLLSNRLRNHHEP